MNRAKKLILLLLSAVILALPGNAFSGDESVLFTSVPPDALIVLDLSGSMNWNPAGGANIFGASTSCVANPSACATGGGVTCSGGYCSASKSGCNVNCSRLAIAKRALFAMLDDTNDNVITSTGTNSDDNNLNIRIGYMRFYNGNDTAGIYSSGNIILTNPIGTKYSTIFCNNATSCAHPGNNPATGGAGSPIATTSATSGTPLSSSLIEAKSYLDWHKGQDTYGSCRDKFVILITDGADTYACDGGGSEDVSDMYKRRRETVARAKALGDAGYKVFVIGFGGDMPLALKRTLNWAAYYGNTDNPSDTAPNIGDTAGYNIARCPCPAPPAPCPPYAVCTNAPLFPSGVASCDTSPINDPPTNPSTSANDPFYNIAGKSGGVGDRVATANDPATANLSGYAFISGSADELTEALKQVINLIRSATYSFTLTAIATARVVSENNIYEAAFMPIDDDPFWRGHLRKYSLTPTGALGSVEWDAGNVLRLRSASSRNIKTCKSGTVFTDFSTGSLTNQDLGVTTDARRTQIVGYIRGDDALNPEPEDWKLGDIWHSSPVIISTPSVYFSDVRDAGNAFATFRSSNTRTSNNGRRVILAGANDGQLHVFRTSDGAETFSFIPPNMLPKLQLIDHATHPTSKQHQFFVDGPISVGDVWLGSGTGLSKSQSDWKTMVVAGLGRGVGPASQYLWSASANCIPTSSTSPFGYSATYTAGTPYYCGYYAFDFTDTLAPLYKWRLNPSAADAAYLAEPWSKMGMGRVLISGNEKWVGFIGGGGYDYSCSTTPTFAGNTGKAFFVVDLSNGNILRRLNTGNFPVIAQPAMFDTDNDGIVDTAYVGDLGGNIWRFKFCTKAQGTTCNVGDWTGSLFFTGTGRPVYTSVSGAIDGAGNQWVYWGTGDKQCPAVTAVTEHFYALKDGGATYTVANLQTLGVGSTVSGTPQGWRIALPGTGEKVLSDSTIFDGVLYFTTFTPQAGATPCESIGGTGKLYAAHYTKAGGALSGGAASMNLGTGIPSAPVISINPQGTRPDMYITVSGGAGFDARSFKVEGEPHEGSLKKKVIFWRDRRVR